MEMSVIDHQRRASVSTGGAAAMGEPLVMIGQATSIASESGTGGTVTAIGMIPSAQNGNVPKPDIDNMNEARRRPSVQFQSPEPRVLLERIPTYLQPSLPWHDRLMHFTFAWYTVTYVFFSSSPRRFCDG
ncbi:hypothetical protein B0T17DRAFT_545603 [Bombardia bombarda]|uniref:Uncharacterized protein n=1 Tax=Bombardia bombarda TaxID=252184 RepID=A0AA39TLX7_9PEZI|nr:hypothetical protein B0T17DRAFT_545603 [Bombardia bombarda]